MGFFLHVNCGIGRATKVGEIQVNRINKSVMCALSTVLRPVFAAMLLSSIPVAVAAANEMSDGARPDIQRGKKVFEMCAACHSVSGDGAHAMGPNLRGIVGEKAGSRSGFKYSKAMMNSGLTWTRDELDAFLEKPMVKIPNNAMPYFGVKDPVDRQAVIEYLTTLQ